MARDPRLEAALRHAFPQPADTEELAPGTFLEQRYEVLGQMARGGVGALLRARDHILGRDVAIKLLQSRHVGRSSLQRHFFDEGRIAAQLEHPGIVPVYEIGMAPDGRPFLVMKLVHGRTLAALLEDAPAGPDPYALLRIVTAVCHVLGYAHSRGVIHRDLKPGNVMVGQFGEVQVVDWGVAKFLRGPLAEGSGSGVRSEVPAIRLIDPAKTSSTGSVQGTFGYMAPEQARGLTEAKDPRVDVFSLGAILCEVLTSRPPYLADTPEGLRGLVERGDISEACQRLRGCNADPALVALAESCLQPAATKRPAHAGAVAAALEAWFASVQSRAHALELKVAASSARLTAERRARRWQVGMAGLVLGLTIVCAVTWSTIERRRRLERDRAAQEVEAALGLAREKEARLTSQDDLASWQEFVASARQAALMAAAREAPEGYRQRADAYLNYAEKKVADEGRRRQKARRNQEMLTSMRDLPSASTRLAPSAVLGTDIVPELYLQCFRTYGIDLEGPEADVKHAIEASEIRTELTDAVASFTALFCSPPAPGSKGARLLELAQCLDGDPIRQRIRRAMQDADVLALSRIAADPDAASWSSTTCILLATALSDQGRTAEAIELARRAYVRNPGDLHLNCLIGDLLWKSGTAPSAEVVRFYSNAASISPESVRGRLNLGIALTNDRRFAEAQAVLQETVALHPGQALVHGALALLLRARCQHEECVVAADRALRLEPDLPVVRSAMYQALVLLGRVSQARQCLEQGVLASPKSIELHVALGFVLSQGGDLNAALARFRVAVSLSKEARQPRDLSELGKAHAFLGSMADAERCFRSAIERDPRDTEGNFGVGRLELEAGNHAVAAEHFRRALEVSPETGGIHYFLGEALYGAGRHAEACSSLREACRLQPSLGEAWMLLSRSAIAQEDHGTAEATLQEALGRGIHFDPAAELRMRGLLADCLLQRGAADRAIEELRPVLSGNENAEGWAQLSRKLLEVGNRRAARAAQQASRERR